MTVKVRKRVGNVGYAVVMVIFCILCTFPFLWMLSISLKEPSQAYDPSVWLFTPVWENFESVFVNRGLMKYLMNSLVIAVLTTVISMILGCMAAYGFARFRFEKQEGLAFWVLSLKMLPPMATVLPFFVMASLCNILDTRLVLIIAYMLFNIPFTIWMMRGFFEDIPYEIEEAARVDGCSILQALRKVVLPMALPGMVATAIFCIINSWNEFVFALFLTSSKANTLPTTVQMFLSVSGVAWGEMSAVGVVSTLPMILFAILVQKYMIRGLTFGAVKG